LSFGPRKRGREGGRCRGGEGEVEVGVDEDEGEEEEEEGVRVGQRRTGKTGDAVRKEGTKQGSQNRATVMECGGREETGSKGCKG
jgi:hypothetical protein